MKTDTTTIIIVLAIVAAIGTMVYFTNQGGNAGTANAPSAALQQSVPVAVGTEGATGSETGTVPLDAAVPVKASFPQTGFKPR